MNKKTKAIICDIDGTLANVEHRRHFIAGDRPDWQSFNESMIVDTVNDWCRQLVLRMCHTHFIIFATGRYEDFRGATECWLAENGLDALGHLLLMRADNDSRRDSIMKEEMYRTHIEPRFDVDFVIDDRQSVVDMWRSLGLVCLQCDEGDF